MLIERKEYYEKDDSLGYVESVFTSGNVLKTTYFPRSNKMYLAFNRGHTYSYDNISNELYENFEKAESQGKFFRENIASKPEMYPYRKEFSLYPYEIEDIREIIKVKSSLNESEK